MPPNLRPVTTPDDEAAVLALTQRIYAATGPRVYLTTGELQHRWATALPPGQQPNACLSWHGATPVGFVWLEGSYALLLTMPDRRDLEPILLDWAAAQPLPPGAALLVHAFDDDDLRQALLHQRGFAPTERGMHLRARALDDIPAPALPAGYTLRHLAGDADIAARAAIYELAFPGERMLPEQIRKVTDAPHYRPHLDLVVCGPDGTFAAFATVWFDPQNRVGVFEPVGCAPEHQRRGLGRALMYAGLLRLRGLGADTALVGTGMLQLRANRLYEATGFQMVGRMPAWQQTGSPATESTPERE